jgi:putative tryptophan/tyrosine transport system substrate-binding protein
VRSLEDLKRAFESARGWRAEVLNVLASPLLHALRQPIIDHAARNRLPAIYQWEESATAGGLTSYGPSRRDVFRIIVVQLDRVLKGAKPADLPVEQPTKFELVINLKTAKALGLTIPQSILVRADRVID